MTSTWPNICANTTTFSIGKDPAWSSHCHALYLKCAWAYIRKDCHKVAADSTGSWHLQQKADARTCDDIPRVLPWVCTCCTSSVRVVHASYVASTLFLPLSGLCFVLKLVCRYGTDVSFRLTAVNIPCKDNEYVFVAVRGHGANRVQNQHARKWIQKSHETNIKHYVCTRFHFQYFTASWMWWVMAQK